MGFVRVSRCKDAQGAYRGALMHAPPAYAPPVYAPPPMAEAIWAHLIEARDQIMAMVRPGASCLTIYEAFIAHLAKMNLPPISFVLVTIQSLPRTLIALHARLQQLPHAPVEIAEWQNQSIPPAFDALLSTSVSVCFENVFEAI